MSGYRRFLRSFVFNSPFNSFHDTVAEAKEEREQLDRLLTISTPRERLLVAGIALSLLIVAAWLFLGGVARNLALDGVLVASGDGSFEGRRSVQAVVWVESDVAEQIEAGMPAVIELAATGREADMLDGKIATIGAVPVPEGLAPFGSAAPVSAHRVGISFDEAVDIAYPEDGECRIVIKLGSQSPAALFGMRRP